jgi:glycerol uptake facilitator protein
MSPYTAEFLGTMLLVILGDGVVANVLLKGTKGESAGLVPIVVTWGVAVTLAIYAVGRISGAHLNPAVTIAFFASGDFPANQVIGYILAQLAGGFSGGVIVWLFYFPHWEKTESQDLKLGVFCTAPAVRSTVWNLLSELIATAVLVLGLLFIGKNNFAEGLNPIVVGTLIIAIGFGLGGTTGFAINPARDLGPRIAHFILPISGKGHSDWSYSWIPVLGPILGGLFGAWIFNMMF